MIELSSNENEIIVDSFMGSGITLIACKNLNRKFIGVEIDRNYCRNINKRLRECGFRK